MNIYKIISEIEKSDVEFKINRFYESSSKYVVYWRLKKSFKLFSFTIPLSSWKLIKNIFFYEFENGYKYIVNFDEPIWFADIDSAINYVNQLNQDKNLLIKTLLEYNTEYNTIKEKIHQIIQKRKDNKSIKI